MDFVGDVNAITKCSKCAEMKPLHRFVKDRFAARQFRPYCKDCRHEQARGYYKMRPAIMKKAHHIKRYGLTIDMWNEMFQKQNGCCKICNIHQSDLKKELFVDHCHDSGQVRGLLCHGCNSALGLLKENPIIMQNMINYLNPSLEDQKSNVISLFDMKKAG